MEKLNYFTGEVGLPELNNYFYSLDENKRKYELENFTNQYLELSEEEQLKYARNVLSVCMGSVKQINKITVKKLLATLNKILLENGQSYSWFENLEYVCILL